jgi:hypothetical protein
MVMNQNWMNSPALATLPNDRPVASDLLSALLQNTLLRTRNMQISKWSGLPKTIARVVTVLLAVLVLNFAIAMPAHADRPLSQNPDYRAANQALSKLLDERQAKQDAGEVLPDSLTAAIDQLSAQTFALESGVTWGQCENTSGQVVGVYGPEPDDADNYRYATGLYFLANGETTAIEWDCEGILIPKDASAVATLTDGQNQDFAGLTALKVADGTRVTVGRDAATGKLTLSTAPTAAVNAAQANWPIPSLSQAAIDRRPLDAPTLTTGD